MIAKTLIRYFLLTIRELIDEYLYYEEPAANKEELNAFYGWLVRLTKED